MPKDRMSESEENDLRSNPINIFKCGCKECEKLEPMVFEEFKHHLFTTHNLKADQLKGKKQMTMHMDGAQWFSYDYTWTLETGLVFYQHVMMARSKSDQMRFG